MKGWQWRATPVRAVVRSANSKLTLRQPYWRFAQREIYILPDTRDLPKAASHAELLSFCP